MKHRSRIIKGEFFQNRKLAGLSTCHRLLFIGLWTIADREGRLLDDLDLIKAMVFPFENIDIDKLLTDLAGFGFIERYNGSKEACIFIPKFLEHQKIHTHEAQSKLPEPQNVVKCSVMSPTDSEISIGRSNSNSIEEEVEVREEEKSEAQELIDLFNRVLAPPLDKVKILRPGSKRLKTIKVRLSEHPEKKFWEHIYKVVSESNFLCGRRGGWKADFNWLLNPNRLEEIYEGKYDNNPIMTAQEEAQRYKRRNNA